MCYDQLGHIGHVGKKSVSGYTVRRFYPRLRALEQALNGVVSIDSAEK